MICRAFTAIKEGYGDTWISNNVQFINHYSPNGMALTSDEARGVPKAYVWLLALYWAMTTVGPPVYMHACGVAKLNRFADVGCSGIFTISLPACC